MTKRTGDEPTKIESIDPNVETKILSPEQAAYKTNKVSDPTAQTTPDPFSSTATIGDYRIIRKIGEGGMGVVYEAEQQNPHRLVALKVIRGGLHSDDYHVKMFEREIEALARLKHPGIASIYESGRSDDGQIFFAMELVNGVALSDFVEQRRSISGDAAPAIDEQLALFAQIGDVVSHAHQRGVIHRDLKPQNVLVTGEADTMTGERFGVKILDFGLARINDPDFRGNTGVSQVGQIKGTLLYMSPEQVRGSSDEIDVRSDVYALGVMLYEMLSGQMPYDLSKASLPEAMRIICEEPPKLLSKAWTETHGRSGRIDRDVETIALKALEKEPDRRYQSVASMLDDIERYLNNQPITARPPSAYYQFRKLVSRHKAAFASMATIFLLLLGFGVVMAAQSVRIANERDKAEQARTEAEEQRSQAEKARNDALIAKNDEQKQREIALRNLDRAESETKRANEEKTKAQNAQKAEAKQRSIAEDNLREAQQQKVVAQTQTKIATEQTSIAETRKTEAENQAEANRRLLYVSQINLAEQAWEQGDVARVDELLENQIPTDGQVDLRGFEWYRLWRVAHLELQTFRTGMILSASISPDGNKLVVTSFDAGLIPAPGQDPKLKITVLDIPTGRTIATLDSHMSVGFRGDGMLRVIGEGDIFRLYDLTTKELTPMTKVKMTSFLQPVFSPDGTKIASLGRGDLLEILDAATGEIIVSLKGNAPTNPIGMMFSMYSRPIRFSQDGKILVYARGDQVEMWDAITGEKLESLKDGSPGFASVALSPDSKILASQNFDGTVKLWDLATRKESASLKAVSQSDFGTGFPFVDFSPDGNLLASISGRVVRLWDVKTKQEVATIRGHGREISSLSFSTDGTKLVTVGSDMITKVWSLPIADSSVLKGALFGSLSANGKTLATSGLDVRLWDMESDREIGAFGGTQTMAKEMLLLPRLSPDGRLVVVTRFQFQLPSGSTGDFFSAMGSVMFRGGPVELWDTKSKQKIAVLENNGKPMYEFSPDSRELALLALDNMTSLVRVIDLPSQTTRFSIKNGGVMTYSPDGKILAVGVGVEIKFFDSSNGQELFGPIKLAAPAGRMAFSPDGRTIAAGVGAGVVLWNFASRKEVGTLKGHGTNVAYLTYSFDGKRIATTALDGVVKIWDTQTRQSLISLKTKVAMPAVFLPDGKTLITGGTEGSQIWRGAADEEVAKQRGH